MRYLHLPTFFVFAVSIFSISSIHFELVNAIQYYSTAFFVILIIIYYICVFGMERHVVLPKDKIFKTVCILAILEIIYAVFQLFGIVPDNFHYAYFSGSLNNPAIFGMMLSFCIPISVYYTVKTIGIKHIIWGIFILIFGIFVLCSNSRTAILASVCGTVIILIMELKFFHIIISNRLYRCIVIVCIVVSLIILYFYKRDSADGRILIWTVCVEMIKDKPWLGWGFDGYIAHYMDYQADYLITHPDSPFILLAGETQNPFNEFLHVAIIYGIPCALMFVGILIWSIWYIYKRVNEYKSILLSMVCILIVWCFFCYPFNISFVWLMILYIILCLVPSKIHLYRPKICVVVALVLSMCTLYMLGTNAVHDFRRLYVQESSANWDYDEIMERYESMYGDYNEDFLFLYNYGALLHLYGNYQRSLEVFQQGTKYLSDYNMMLLMGDDYQKLERYDEAIACYKRAGEMIPSRYLPLYYQMKLYQENENLDESHRIAHIILKKENKIKKSRITQQVIKEAIECLKN